MMRKLVLSFTGLLYALKADSITSEDLDTALYYFGCTYDHIMNPCKNGGTNELEWAFGCNAERGKKAHTVVVKAVKKAKRECRAMFNRAERPANYDDLNYLLWMHELPTIDTGKLCSKRYSPRAAKNAIESQKIGIDVITIC